VTLDADNEVTEVSEINNTITQEFFIYEDEVSPAYPYKYSIVKDPAQKLYASTANPFRTTREYVMEIDTSALFNSPLKKQTITSSVGGLIEYNAPLTYLDSTVYYWRTAVKPSTGGDYVWNTASFLFKLNSSEGFNQSHLYQHTQSNLVDIGIDSTTRNWNFGILSNSLYVRNGVFPTAAGQADDFLVDHNGNTDIKSVCGVGGILVNVFDQKSFNPWFNGVTGVGQYYSDVVCGNNRRYNFQFYIGAGYPEKRKYLRDFLDVIPDGDYVVVRNVAGSQVWENTYASDWQSDTATLGSGNTFYHRLLEQGFTAIDSINQPRAFIFVYQKNRKNIFPPKFVVSDGIYDKLTLSSVCPTPDTAGYINSPAFGPAKAWKQLHWSGKSVEPVSTDNVSIDIIGVNKTGTESTLATINETNHDFDISFIDAAQYPFVKLSMRNCDSINLTPYQLKYWKLDYDPVPEGALTPAIFFKAKDTLEVGETVGFWSGFQKYQSRSFR
jgi:hypothetical protein